LNEEDGALVLSGSNNIIRTHLGFDGMALSTDNPLLAPLDDNGGPTLTHALLIGSPAIDSGNNLLNLTTDQRSASFTRDVGAGVDIGAFEEQDIVPQLFGDYNRDDVVGAADYVLWRKTMGQETIRYSGADGNGSEQIDPGDYEVWAESFGDGLAGGGGAAVAMRAAASELEAVSKPAPLGRGQGEGAVPIGNSPSPQPSPGGRGSVLKPLLAELPDSLASAAEAVATPAFYVVGNPRNYDSQLRKKQPPVPDRHSTMASRRAHDSALLSALKDYRWMPGHTFADSTANGTLHGEALKDADIDLRHGQAIDGFLHSIGCSPQLL
jgi:hypothetical protein